MRYDFSNSGNAKRRIVCLIMGVILVLASMVPAGLRIFAGGNNAKSDIEVNEASKDGFKHLSFELHPDEEDMDKTITLDGVMPKNASAEVVEVTDEYTEDEQIATSGDAERSSDEGFNTDNVAAPKSEKAEKESSERADEREYKKDNFETEDVANNGTDDEAVATDSNAGSEKDYTDATDGDADSETDDTEDASSDNEENDDANSGTTDETVATDGDADADNENDETEKYSRTIAAYDITIKVGNKEYQPSEERPIKVEITDSRIKMGNGIHLFHIKDSGETEEIKNFTIEEGKISFEAAGFSVYKIVAASSETDTRDILDILEEKGERGYYASFMASENGKTNGPYYFTGGTVAKVVDTGRTGLEITDKATVRPGNAVKLYFKHAEGEDNTKYYIYIKDGNEEKYVKMFRNNSFAAGRSALDFVSKNEATLFTIDVNGNNANQIRFHTTISGAEHYWVRNTKNDTVAVVGYSSSTDPTLVWVTLEGIRAGDVNLDGKTYGLMNYTGGTHGYALMAGEEVHTLVELITHQTATSEGITLYVDEGSEVSRWTFCATEGGKYKLSAETDEGVKYLAVNGDALTLADSADTAAGFYINNDSEKIQLEYNGKYVTFYYTDNGEEVTTSFALSSESSANSWLNLIDFATLTDEDYITYSADRVSVSDVKNGQRVIVYTRIWNETSKQYDIYAVNHNGTLFPCYASGGKILWLADGTGSLEWEFTEYIDSVTKEPNYYYELYNPYSDKYIVPQMETGKVLSDSAKGINMQGRRNGEFFSPIIAWDDSYYAYVGMKPDDENKRLVPCSEASCYPFYFATLEEINLSDRLHPVKTVDNTVHGISMKMIDFEGTGGSDGGTEQKAYLENTGFTSESAHKGILSTNLGSNGYPIAKDTNLSLSGLYQNAVDVNHLFIDSIYNASGYFEYDSTQNFATLKATNDNNFTVYREIATTDGEIKTTLQHGQFFPYNTISVGNYSEDNPLNLYNTDARTGNNNINKGILPEDDPRKYERLYSVGHKDGSNGKDKVDYYFGMEMSAQFVQTVSGLDAWGHDIIFEFKGDDDFWLYVDGELVIDLGGIHSALGGKVNFRTGEVEVNGTKTTLRNVFKSNMEARGETNIDARLEEIFDTNSAGQYIFRDYTKHTMKLFYMERGAGASNLKIKFNIASVTPGHVVISKNLQGEGVEDLNTDFLEYPFQIYYTIPEGENGVPGEEILLGNDDEHIRVIYQNSNQAVTYVQKYRPPGFTEEQAYNNIYFINPKRNAEILFPDDAITYRIVECAVDSTVYENVLINGDTVPDERVEIRGNLKSYSSEVGSAENKPSISFDNCVKDDVIKELHILKELQDENGNPITDDPTTFSFRLHLSSVDVAADDIPSTNMYSYYVLSPAKKICRFDPAIRNFAETDLKYTVANMDEIKAGHVPGLTIEDITFKTSGFGAISNIPSGYEIVVPGLPVGSIFKVTEDIKPGYGLYGYEMIMGEKVDAEGHGYSIASYRYYEGNPANVGKVIGEENPHVKVINKKGYGLNVNKKWSDLSLTSYHEPVYTAVYVDGELLEDSVRQIASPSTSAYYFWTSLKPNADGTERTSLDGYVVKEVVVSGCPAISADGKVTGYDTVTPVAGKINLLATRTAEATPVGEDPDKNYDYVVSYEQGVDNGSTRTDTITNTREGGIALRLFKWNSSIPLKNGRFTLKDSSGNVVGEYKSDADGIITMLYTFEYDEIYTLVQDAAPAGYVGLQKKLCFKVNTDDTVSLYYKDGTTDWGSLDEADNKWANWKQGQNGITAYVDIYNKQFNFKLMKLDSEDTDIKLGAAHFALYKQANTTISGYVKPADPMTGFEDMVTDKGELDICGGSSGRVIDPGPKGSVYFLTETKAPATYTALTDDIIFKISPLGVPSLVSDSYNGQLLETEDSYIYTLSVPNTKKQDGKVYLTVTKTVSGNRGNKNQDFIFHFKVDGDDGTTEYEWIKNGEEMTTPLTSGGTHGIFRMEHGDVVMIALPLNAVVTITEDNEDYTTTMKLGDDPAEERFSKEITITGDTTLSVTNTREGIIPTGIESHILVLTGIFVLLLAAVLLLLRGRFRRYTDE